MSVANSTLASIFRKIPGASLHVSKPTHWLESRFHFSFADYYDEKRSNYGVLRVLNDDLVIPKEGFGTHPHRDMEIITYVVDGHLTHKDSMGNVETLERGAVQFLSAGTGITHSEYNASKQDMLRFLQLWVMPRKRGLKTNYGSKRYTDEQRKNTLLKVATDNTDGGSYTLQENSDVHLPIRLNQDVNIFVCELDRSKTVSLPIAKGRQAYLVCIEGGLSITSTANNNDQIALDARDAVKITGDGEVVVTATGAPARQENVKQLDGTHFLAVEMPFSAE